jgi:hypothetical protein
MKDYLYSSLKENERAYEIMLLRDQCGETLSMIAKEYDLSIARVQQIYHHIKRKQMCLYIRHISIVFGQKDTEQVRKIFNDANEWYRDLTYATAYLEKKYRDILIEYRAGEPGMPKEFIRNMPPFQPGLRKETIDCVVRMREKEKASYIAIAKKLCMTPAKARDIYERFYHQKVLVMLKELGSRMESYEERMALRDHYFETYKAPKKRYDALIKKISQSDQN